MEWYELSGNYLKDQHSIEKIRGNIKLIREKDKLLDLMEQIEMKQLEYEYKQNNDVNFGMIALIAMAISIFSYVIAIISAISSENYVNGSFLIPGIIIIIGLILIIITVIYYFKLNKELKLSQNAQHIVNAYKHIYQYVKQRFEYLQKHDMGNNDLCNNMIVQLVDTITDKKIKKEKEFECTIKKLIEEGVNNINDEIEKI